jgi:hypothetical protein
MTSWPCNGVLCTDGTDAKVGGRGDMKKLAVEKALLLLSTDSTRFWWNSVSAYSSADGSSGPTGTKPAKSRGAEGTDLPVKTQIEWLRSSLW